MDKDPKQKADEETPENDKMESRRDFFTGLGKWSKVVIGAVLLGAAALPADGQAQDRPKWYNDRCRQGPDAPPPGGGTWTNTPPGGTWSNTPPGGWPSYYEDDSWGRCKCGQGWSNQRCWSNQGGWPSQRCWSNA